MASLGVRISSSPLALGSADTEAVGPFLIWCSGVKILIKMIGRDRPAMVAVGGLFEAAFLTRLQIVIAHPGDPVASGHKAIIHEIGMHARTPISLPRQAKTLTDMGKKQLSGRQAALPAFPRSGVLAGVVALIAP